MRRSITHDRGLQAMAARARWFGNSATSVLRHPVLLVLFSIVLLFLLLGPITQWATPVTGLQGKELADVRNTTRQILLAAVGGIAVLTGLAFTGRTYYLTRRGQITDRYAAAIRQLASDKTVERLGGIYALEHIMIESERDHNTIVEVLAAFVREEASIHTRHHRPLGRSTRTGTAHTGRPRRGDTPRPSSDIQAALTVLARRPPRKEANPVDLRFTDLRGTDLSTARFDHADLECVDLRHADLTAAQFRHTNLLGARLDHTQLKDAQLPHANLGAASFRHATLWKADLRNADLVAANLVHANLPDVSLQHANLSLADLSRANLDGADLRGTIVASARDTDGVLWRFEGQDLTDLVPLDGLTPDQLANAIVDDTTVLPPGWKDVHHSKPAQHSPAPTHPDNQAPSGTER